MIYQPEEALLFQHLPTCVKCGYEELDLANFYEERFWECPKCGIKMKVVLHKEILFDMELVK